MEATAPMPTSTRVALLKQSDEDFEWYPSTREMIRPIVKVIKKWYSDRHGGNDVSILDIGAGDGRVLEWIAEGLQGKDNWDTIRVKKRAIEKSSIHIANMPKDIVILGTDFHQQTLVDKRVDAVFCNPPYSEFERWAARIIRETPSKSLFLIIPQRWRESEEIKAALEYRGVSMKNTKSLGEFDFEDAERQARAKVEVVFVSIKQAKNDAFDKAIEEMLPELDRFEEVEEPDERTTKEDLTQMVEASDGNIIRTLVDAYDTELAHILESYQALVKMNPTLLKEVGVTKETVLTGIRNKMEGLKDRYWSTLFDHLGEVTKKLATKQRNEFKEALTGKSVVDFTEDNIRSMLVWIAKWASDYFDIQLVELYKRMSQLASIEGYKSNQKVFKSRGGWRYLREDESHYKLCFRMVLECTGGINTSNYSWEGVRGLTNRAHELLMDFITVTNNLGFPCEDRSDNHDWKPNKKVQILLDDGRPLMDVRAFKNGNMHLRIDKKVMLAINVQAGKLLGWLRDAAEAVDELEVDAKDAEFVQEKFAFTNRIEPSNLLRICAA